MKTIREKLRSMRFGKNTLWFLIMMLIGIGMFYLLFWVLGPFGPFSRYPAAILLMYIGIAFLSYMDKVYHSEIDTNKAIQENNITYGLILLAYALIIGAVINSV
jgi:4-hydroxybenzoate polyprenyltransferase